MFDVLTDHYDELTLDESRTDLADRFDRSQGKITVTIPVPSEPAVVTDAHVEQAATAVIELINHYHSEIVREFQ